VEELVGFERSLISPHVHLLWFQLTHRFGCETPLSLFANCSDLLIELFSFPSGIDLQNI